MTLPRGVGVGAGGGADGRVGCASLVRVLRSESDACGLLSAELSRPVCAEVGVSRAGESAQLASVRQTCYNPRALCPYTQPIPHFQEAILAR